ncbi:MAG: RNHCP domain-containing protein [Planctomycetota bacterium]
MEEKRFRRVIENFFCVHCREEVRGDGYTNHCPACLTSLHVDINPGDRAAECDWPMPAVQVRRDGKRGFVILHRCDGCGHEKWNRAAEQDDRAELSRLLI